MSENDAILLALQCYRQPQRKFPAVAYRDGMPRLLKLAAGNTEAVELVVEQTGESSHDIQAAAIFFLQQMLVKPGLDNYAVLGLRPGSSMSQIKEHKRLLLMWLHPDKNHNRWETMLFQRVLAAAKALEQTVTASPQTAKALEVTVTPEKIHNKANRKKLWEQAKRRSPVFIWKLFFKRAIRSIVYLGGVTMAVLGVAVMLASSKPTIQYYLGQVGWQIER